MRSEETKNWQMVKFTVHCRYLRKSVKLGENQAFKIYLSQGKFRHMLKTLGGIFSDRHRLFISRLRVLANCQAIRRSSDK